MAGAARMKAIILAAGVGKRLWPVTQHKPKCLDRDRRQTLLSRYLESWLPSRQVRDHCGRVQTGDD